MLFRVAARARPDPHDEPNVDEGPNTFDGPSMLARCGILPARRRERRVAALGVFAGALLNAVSAAEPGLNGLVDGVGLEVLEVMFVFMLAMLPGADMREGRVPARPRLAGLLMPVSVRGTRSGKPSWLGDSGISKRGVDVPLVGGPHILGDKPLADCSSRVRFGKSRAVWSCKGEPAPILAPDRLARPVGVPLAPEKGDLLDGMLAASDMVGRDPRFRFSACSGRVGAMLRSSWGESITVQPASLRLSSSMLGCAKQSVPSLKCGRCVRCS